MLAKMLNPKLFAEDVEQMPTRNGYGEGLVAAGKKNPNAEEARAALHQLRTLGGKIHGEHE